MIYYIIFINIIILTFLIYMILYLTKKPKSQDENKLKILKLKQIRSKKFVKIGFIISIIFITLKLIANIGESRMFLQKPVIFGEFLGNIIFIVVLSFIISLISNYFKKFETDDDLK